MSTRSNLVFDQGRQGEVIKEIGEVFPDVGVAVFAQNLVVKAVYLGNLPRLVVSPQNSDAVLIPHFQRHQKNDSLNRMVATVHVIAHEPAKGYVSPAPVDRDFFEKHTSSWYPEHCHLS